MTFDIVLAAAIIYAAYLVIKFPRKSATVVLVILEVLAGIALGILTIVYFFDAEAEGKAKLIEIYAFHWCIGTLGVVVFIHNLFSEWQGRKYPLEGHEPSELRTWFSISLFVLILLWGIAKVSTSATWWLVDAVSGKDKSAVMAFLDLNGTMEQLLVNISAVALPISAVWGAFYLYYQYKSHLKENEKPEILGD